MCGLAQTVEVITLSFYADPVRAMGTLMVQAARGYSMHEQINDSNGLPAIFNFFILPTRF
jgi:hypothetical protein